MPATAPAITASDATRRFHDETYVFDGLSIRYVLEPRYTEGCLAGGVNGTNVTVALEEGWDDVVRRTIYTLRPTEYEAITRAIDAVTGGAEHPAQTIVGVTGLAVPGLLIEIECTAVLP